MELIKKQTQAQRDLSLTKTQSGDINEILIPDFNYLQDRKKTNHKVL